MLAGHLHVPGHHPTQPAAPRFHCVVSNLDAAIDRYWVLGSIGYWEILLLAVIHNTDTAWTPWYQLPADDSRAIGEEVR